MFLLPLVLFDSPKVVHMRLCGRRLLPFVVACVLLVVVGSAGAGPQANFTLTIALSAVGSGSGSVVSSPAGINTANGQNSISVRSGTAVTLTATATGGTASNPVYFAGWYSTTNTPITECSSGSANPCAVTVSANRTITAVFVDRNSVLAAVGSKGGYTGAVPTCVDDAPVGFRLACGTISKGDSGSGLGGIVLQSGCRSTGCLEPGYWLYFLSGGNLTKLDPNQLYRVGVWDVAAQGGNLAWADTGSPDAPINELTGAQLRAGVVTPTPIAANLLGENGTCVREGSGTPPVYGPCIPLPWGFHWNNSGTILALIGKRTSDQYCDAFKNAPDPADYPPGNFFCAWTIPSGSSI